MTIYLIVGLPGAGKTTRAKELEGSESALRLTPDDWLMALFEGDSPTQWRSTKRVDHRARIEGKLIEAGMRAAQLGLNVVLDFGFWSKDERTALRSIASSLNISTQVVYLPIGYDEQLERITERYATEPGQFLMTAPELKQWQVEFEAPDGDELAGTQMDAVPPGQDTWRHWACWRWPSLAGTQLILSD